MSGTYLYLIMVKAILEKIRKAYHSEMARTRCKALVDGLLLRERPFGLESSVSTKNSTQPYVR